ncbi:uncharacterized protein LOC113324818 [Papaver somniferum]|uniref:uncharacterized protein LOC113324818 n=1 Tax=Papaver somniferum TaxID=3469 RepID=UPI000E6FB61A|nr:uncharacterized protein LOC113324818 [Papaver somniferum]
MAEKLTVAGVSLGLNQLATTVAQLVISVNQTSESVDSSNSYAHQDGFHSVIPRLSHRENSKFTRTPKVDFPRFNGINPRGWALKCNHYFHLHMFPDEERVDMDAIHFDSQVDPWFLNYQQGKESISWDTSTKDLCARYEDVAQDNYVGSFNKLSQNSSVEAYYDQWEHYKTFMVANNPTLPENFYTLSFISGLKEEIRTTIQMFKPDTTSEAFFLARMQQTSLQHMPKPLKSFSKPFAPPPLSIPQPSSSITPFYPPSTAFGKSSGSSSQPIVTHPTTPTKTSPDKAVPPIRHLTYVQMQQRKYKGLCYNCDEFYRQGHKCKTQQLFMLITDEDIEEPEQISNTTIQVDSPPPSDSTLEISLHALTENVVHDIICIAGHLQKKPIMILIDTGITHSFIDSQLTEQLGIHASPTGHMVVTVANGDSTISKGICHTLGWEMHGNQFSFDLRVLPLGGYDMVLGDDWLHHPDDITFSFSQLRISFMHQGNHITLQGSSSNPSLSLISASAFKKYVKSKVPTLLGQFFSNSTSPPPPTPSFLTLLVNSYSDIFAEPSQLPPPRALDYKIPLKPNSSRTYQRLYRCLYIQKSVVEYMVQEMLNT